jgi:hypothetical protein
MFLIILNIQIVSQNFLAQLHQSHMQQILMVFFFVLLGSFCLRDPPAAFLEFANCLEIFLKSDLDI